MRQVLLRDFHFIFIEAYQTITLLSQIERLDQLTLTPLVTTVYLSHLLNPTLSQPLSSICLPKSIRNEGCFIFSQEVVKRITKSIFTVLK